MRVWGGPEIDNSIHLVALAQGLENNPLDFYINKYNIGHFNTTNAFMEW